MQEQWTIGTTMFHTITGDADLLNAKKAEILEAINAAVNSIVDIPDITVGVTVVETYVGDSVVECTTGINDETSI